MRKCTEYVRDEMKYNSFGVCAKKHAHKTSSVVTCYSRNDVQLSCLMAMTMTRTVRTDVGSSPQHNTLYPYFAGFTQADLHREERVCYFAVDLSLSRDEPLNGCRKKVHTIYDGQGIVSTEATSAMVGLRKTTNILRQVEPDSEPRLKPGTCIK